MKQKAIEWERSNSQKPCRCGCGRLRYRLSQYSKACQGLAKARNLYGHPQGRSVSKQELHPYDMAVKNIVTHNLHHPAVKDAITFFKNWTELAEQGANVPVPDTMVELKEKGIDAQQIVVALAGLIYYSFENPSVIPVERMCLTLMLGRRLLQLPRKREVRMTPVRIAGAKIWVCITALFKIARETQERLKNDLEKRKEYEQPFRGTM